MGGLWGDLSRSLALPVGFALVDADRGGRLSAMGGARPLWWLQKAIHLPAPALACAPVSQACG
ncbi:hypothetical protein DTW92_18835 [Paracoccus pantotrophus]|nr:hypothetical protein DTW92_18835 [Paracoccus pantotrophus]